MKRGSKLKAGMKMVYPSGTKYWEIVQRIKRNEKRMNWMIQDDDKVAMNATLNWIKEKINEQKESVRLGNRYSFNIRIGIKEVSLKERFRVMANRTKKLYRKKKKRTKATAAGKEPDPKNVMEALDSSSGVEWAKALGNEFFGLVEMGVFDLGYTKQQLIDQGITSSPVPLTTVLNNKYGETGELEKRKARIAVSGHPGNMQKGIHYTETFSATPRENTMKILCALIVELNLHRMSFDISKAYCWADLPPGELIALKYPETFQQVHPETGEELFIIMRKNLYGHPAAGRTFGKARDKAILEKFNQHGWECIRTRMDPCLFIISKTDKDNKRQRAWMCAHVDDCDVVGTSVELLDDIKNICQSIWKISIVENDFMLGIKREIKRDTKGTVSEVECTMTAFVDGMYESFREYILDKKVSEPVPHKFTTSKGDHLEDDEPVEVLRMGYQNAVGMLLWAARHCYPECKVGCSMLGRVMAKPSYKAFSAAMHMMKWMHQERERGIKYSKEGNTIPIAMVDASNLPDSHDGKCQYGIIINWKGGPICTVSRKLNHVGLSSAHNEYMAMSYANQNIVWMRQLMKEMGLEEYIKYPTPLWADNKPANILSREDIVTSGNQYIYLPYHYNKEAIEQGISYVFDIPSRLNISDLMTKSVNSNTLKQLIGAITGYDTNIILEFEKRSLEKLDPLRNS